MPGVLVVRRVVVPAVAWPLGSGGELRVVFGVVSVRLGRDLPENDRRQDYLRSELTEGPDGALIATPFDRQDSAMLSLLARAGCLVIRPPHAPAAQPGEPVPILPLDGLI